MKKLIVLTCLCWSFIAEAQFTAGNLVVIQAGDGSGTVAAGVAAPILVKEFTPTGVAGTSIALPTTGPQRIVINQSVFGHALTVEKDKILIGGYDAAVGTVAVHSTSNSTRVINSVSYNGTITREFSGASTDYFGTAFRGVAGSGSSIWGAGQGTATTGGIMYLGSGTPTQVSGTVSSTRFVNVFNGQMYASTGVGVSGQIGIYAIGSGVPTAGGATASIVVNTTASGSGTASPYGFAFNAAGNICYIADDRTIATGGGIQKWVLNAGTWSLAYTLSPATPTQSTVGARSLVVDFSGSNPIIYATTSESVINRLIRIVDAGATSSATLVAAPATNTYFGAVVMAPVQNVMPLVWGSFTATKQDNAVSLQWNTMQEQYTDKFIVWKSNDAANWEIVGTVKARNTAINNNYSLLDKSTNKGISYYRIQQVDLDGKFAFSKVISINFNKPQQLILFGPNPAKDMLNVQLPENNGTLFQLAIVDMYGRKYSLQSTSRNSLQLNVGQLPAGIYALQLLCA